VRVAIGVRSKRDHAESVAEEVVRLGGTAMPVVADLSYPDAAQAAIAQITATLGPPLILVNNAAVRPRRPFLQITPQEWDDVLRVNLSAMFYLAQAALPGMLAAGIGRIVNVSGGDAIVGSVHRVHVTSAKAGVIGFTRALAKELALETNGRVTVNAVVPNAIGTEREHANWQDVELAAELNKMAADSPVKRLGTSDEVAAVCAFLASREASYMVGQTLYASGGRIMS
jgi:NAD(P)-dependent dehydrogenase (short-subunit alcohol dehydrogenase family)